MKIRTRVWRLFFSDLVYFVLPFGKISPWLCIMFSARAVDDMQCRTSTCASPDTSPAEARRRSHSVAELDCIGRCRRTTRLSCSVPLVPENCRQHTAPSVMTSSSRSKSDDALENVCGAHVTRLHHYQLL